MIITLCGSRKNLQMFDIVKDELETKFHIVLEPNWSFSEEDLEKFTDEQFRRLHEVHYRKMAMSDMVVIINLPTGVGDDTQREIDVAKKLGIPVYRVSDYMGRNGEFIMPAADTEFINSISSKDLVKEIERRTEIGELSFDVSITTESND